MSARRCIDSQKLKIIWRKEVGMVTIGFIDINDPGLLKIARCRELRFRDLKLQVDGQNKGKDTTVFPRKMLHLNRASGPLQRGKLLHRCTILITAVQP